MSITSAGTRGWKTAAGCRPFPNARYVFGKTEFDYWTEQHAKTPVPPFADSVLPIVEAKRLRSCATIMRSAITSRILPTPGHTPGHVAFTLRPRQGRRGVLRRPDAFAAAGALSGIVGEVRRRSRRRPAKTRRSFLERYCDTDTLCCTAHFPSPSVGKIRRLGNGFTCEAV